MKMGLNNQFLVAFLASVLALALFSVNPAAARAVAVGTTNTEFIKTSCQATTYPNLCYRSLSSHASEIGADPELLAKTALTVTLQTTKSTSAKLAKLAAETYNLTRREVGAMRDCIEELHDSVDRIRRSMEEMKELSGPDFDMKMSDIETWVSAALTDDDTCTEGFAGKSVDGKLKTAVRAQIRKVAHLTSNALALINSFAALHN
ncbi:PREDICTED: 21 kDa protein-like [Ipomoea nil]|uniref:21 kDa protein-like n=1 Tax=Ipomoea nil TaxID=35883 RepID=UPI000901FB56|nr:PREDICTED: 21 kDa protein-like [Ipomoea nil]